MKNSKAKDTVLAAMCTVLLAISAQITIPSAVPFTLQTFAVAYISAALGAKRSAMTVCSYILLGIIGLPVFSGFRAGASVVLGATGGYTIGFIFFALISGFMSEKNGKSIPALILSMLSGLIVCYAFGTAWYVLVYLHNTEKISAALSVCVVPFVVPDLVKTVLAAICVKKLKLRFYG